MDYVRVKKICEDHGICNSGVLRPCGHLQFSGEETVTVVGDQDMIDSRAIILSLGSTVESLMEFS